MIRDLAGAGHVSATAQVVIVGGGTLGLVISTYLARKGHSVICLESGGWTQDGESHPLNEVVQLRSTYAGAAGRFRCLGGTSTRWGGALIPYLERDVSDANWPIPPTEILSYREEVERLFGLSAGPYEGLSTDADLHADYTRRYAKWPSFARRNVFSLLRANLTSEGGPTLWLNATATEFRVDRGALRSIVGRSPDGSRIEVKCGHVVFAAGAIETTRLLLLLDQQNSHCLTKVTKHLGEGLSDHLSAPVANLDVLDRPALNRTFGFHFDRAGRMRNLRFELSETGDARELAPRCFAHVAFVSQPEGPFDTLRDVFRSIQQGKWPQSRSVLSLCSAAPWLLRLLWWRMIERRLLFPDDAILSVHMVTEQSPQPANRITLSSQRSDVFGLPLAEISWGVSRRDIDEFHAAADLFERMWRQSRYSKLARFRRLPKEAVEADLVVGGGIYHPVGTTRLGLGPDTGVVDTNLRVFGLSNVSAVSTAVLPTAGGANPTMSALMLALRCVDHVSGLMQEPAGV